MVKAILTSKSDSPYDDLPEQRYHFPRTYRRQIEATRGDWFIYYEPRRSSSDLSSRGGRQCYFATGRIAEVIADPARDGYFYALVDSYLDFARPVPFRDGQHYYESAIQRDDGETNKGAFGRAVRELPDQEYEAILQAAFALVIGEDNATAASGRLDIRGFAEPQMPFERPIVERVVARPFRDSAFSSAIKTAYKDTCGFTGLKIINGGGRSEVQAAHIRPVAAAGPDSMRNGIALCGTAHWMFDRGLISIADNHELLLAKDKVPDQVLRMLTPDRKLITPLRPDHMPHPSFLRWHRDNVFKG